MIKRIASAVAVMGAASVISGCSIEQPASGCILQDASVYAWQAAYIPKTEADAAKTCGQLKGEQLGVWKYANPRATDADRANNTAAIFAIRPRRLAQLTRASYTYDTTEIDAETGKPKKKTVTVTRVPQDKWDDATAVSSSLSSMPDANDFCKATGFSQASITVEAVFNEVNAAKEELAAASRTYQYGDVEVYVNPSAPGTQLRGTLTYTEGDCTAEYNVMALWPSVPCEVGATEPALNCGVGSGINPDFDAVCVAGIGLNGAAACVPNPAVGVPAFKKAE